MKTAITGAAGNLGELLAQAMKDRNGTLNLLFHHKKVAENLRNKENISLFQVDLAKPETLYQDARTRLEEEKLLFEYGRKYGFEAVSYYGDTTRMRQELLPELKYKTYREGYGKNHYYTDLG